MTVAITEELALHPELAYRHTLASYHAMIANGSILEGEPFELLDGRVVSPKPTNFLKAQTSLFPPPAATR